MRNIRVDEGVIGDLEIFVIGDGGSDHTLKIVKEYPTKYTSFLYIRNDEYRATVNYTVVHAVGKCFKLLEGNNWFYRETL